MEWFEPGKKKKKKMAVSTQKSPSPTVKADRQCAEMER